MDDDPEPHALSTLEELPLECWIAIALQSSDRSGLLTSVPLVSRRLRDTLHDPWLRCSVLRALKQADYISRDSVVSTSGCVAVRFHTELEQRADLSRWRQRCEL